MFKGSEIFETHYKDYCHKISQTDLPSLAVTLGIEAHGDGVCIPFLNRHYQVSSKGIRDETGRRPAYSLCVILAQYILLCPDRILNDPQWVSFKDFKKDAQITNVNFFTSDTEKAVLRHFSDNVPRLTNASRKLGSTRHDIGVAYDVSMKFDILPRISLLLLYNDRDEEFPAQCSVLFQKHAEFYLDPESLAMTGAGLTRHLIRAGNER